MSVNVIIDGVPCSKCGKLHPTLSWHDKYDDYLLDRKTKWDEAKAKRPQLFKNAVYKDKLELYGLKEKEEQGKCEVCGCMTYFVNVTTNHYVCSKECKYTDTK